MSRWSILGVLSLSVAVSACGARASLDDGSEGDGATGGTGGTGSGNGTGTGTGNGTGTGSGSTGSGSTGSGSTGSGSTGSTGSGSSTTGSGSSTSGSGPGSGTSAVSGSTGSGMEVCPSFGDPCTGCLSMACPERYCNCYENSDCFDIFECIQPCNEDEACVQACYTKFESGISDASLLTDCAADLCPAACPGNQGGTLDPCNECILESCEGEFNACLAEPTCLQLWSCLNECPQLDLMCQNGCYDAYEQGIPTLQTVLMCATNDCSNPCN
jgi:hypothetical protein